MAKQRFSDEQIVNAYRSEGSVQAGSALIGMSTGAFHRRLSALGECGTINRFTSEDARRLERDYVAYRAHGQVAVLAEEMGRTVQFLSRKARELGLTDARHEKRWKGQWKYMSDDAARVLMDAFKASPLGLGQFCAKHGYTDDGFREALAGRWPDEWEHVIESKAPASTKYRLGRALEYRIRDQLKKLGYFAMRSPASRSPIDVIAVRPGVVLMIQCKRGGTLPPKEWNALFDLATSCGAIPVMAENPVPRTTNYWRLTDRKDGSKRRQPMEPFDPDGPGAVIRVTETT